MLGAVERRDSYIRISVGDSGHLIFHYVPPRDPDILLSMGLRKAPVFTAHSTTEIQLILRVVRLQDRNQEQRLSISRVARS